MAKSLNPCQAQWALFFACFNFTHSNRLSSKNIKADSPTHLYPTDNKDPSPEYILPSSCFVRTTIWKTDSEIASKPVQLPTFNQSNVCAFQIEEQTHQLSTTPATGHPAT